MGQELVIPGTQYEGNVSCTEQAPRLINEEQVPAGAANERFRR